MTFLNRFIDKKIDWVLKHQKSVLLLGPRQTGKTTLLKQKKADLFISLIQPAIRLRYEKEPDLLNHEIEALIQACDHCPLVILDEIQKVPLLIDIVQYYIDEKKVLFILSGSSARKLKHNEQINLIPGRVIKLQLDALALDEVPVERLDLKNILHYGTLPEVLLLDDFQLKQELLSSYVTTYLEEEVRVEALVRNLGAFARFLELAAAESGQLLNMSKLSQTIGVSQHTIQGYYQILEDCLIAESIEPYTQSNNPRRRLMRSKKYLLYDLGVRRLAAKEGTNLPREYYGKLFEQFVGLELIRQARRHTNTRIFYWRDANGPEVDWLIQHDDQLIPIEVKLTDSPHKDDAKHLQAFLAEYPQASKAYVVSRVPRNLLLDKNIMAISWRELASVFKD